MLSFLAVPVNMREAGGTEHLGASLLDLAHGEVKDSAGGRQPFWAMVADPAAAVFDA